MKESTLGRLADVSAYVMLGWATLCGAGAIVTEVSMAGHHGAAVAYKNEGNNLRAESEQHLANGNETERNVALSGLSSFGIMGGIGVVRSRVRQAIPAVS